MPPRPRVLLRAVASAGECSFESSRSLLPLGSPCTRLFGGKVFGAAMNQPQLHSQLSPVAGFQTSPASEPALAGHQNLPAKSGAGAPEPGGTTPGPDSLYVVSSRPAWARADLSWITPHQPEAPAGARNALQTYYSATSQRFTAVRSFHQLSAAPPIALRGAAARKWAPSCGAATPREIVFTRNCQRGDQPGGPQFGAMRTSGPANEILLTVDGAPQAIWCPGSCWLTYRCGACAMPGRSRTGELRPPEDLQSNNSATTNQGWVSVCSDSANTWVASKSDRGDRQLSHDAAPWLL